MHIRCPHCRNPVEVVGDHSLDDMTCGSCGSNFSLVSDDATNTYRPDTVETIGHFELREKLGLGSFGSVWKAYDPELDRLVAVKIPRKGKLTEDESTQFLREARAAAQFKHPGIVPVHEVGRDGDTIYIVSELVDGLTLTDWLTGQLPTPREASVLCVKIAEALHHAHEQGVIHRDLKPGNVMLDRDGEPHVMDFGLAKREAGEITMTMDGQVLGTPAYMSPEQARGEAHHVDRRSDIYSLGVLLFELLTGERPFRGNSRMLIHQVLTDEAPSPRTLNGSVPRDLETISLKCLEKDPDRRYQTAQAVADDLSCHLNGHPISARPVGRLERGWRWARRNPIGALAIGLGVALAVIPSVLSWELFNAKQRADDARYQAEVEKKQAQADRDEKERARLAEVEARKKAIAAQKAALERQKEAEQARKVVTEQRSLALNTVRDILLRIDDLMKRDAKLAALRKEIVQRMIVNVDNIRDHALKNPLVDRTEAVAYARLGDIYISANRVEDASSWYFKAHELLEKLLQEAPSDPNAMRNLAAISHKAAEAVWRLGEGNRSRELHRQGLDLHRKRMKTLTVSDQAVEQLELTAGELEIAESLQLVAFDDLRLGNPVSAIKLYADADQAFRKLPPPFQSILRVHRSLNEIKVRIADAKARLGELDDAERLFREALADRESLLNRQPETSTVVGVLKDDIGQSKMYLGDFYLFFRKDRVRAAKEYAACVTLFTAMLDNEPDNLDFKQRLGASLNRLGVAADDPQEAKDAFVRALDFRQELAKIDPNDQQAQLEVASSLARIGREEDAVSIVDRLLETGKNDRFVMFQVGCVLSILSAETRDPKSASQYRDRAFEVLRDLKRIGWADRGSLTSDPDFDGIRNDPRFAELLNSWESD